MEPSLPHCMDFQDSKRLPIISDVGTAMPPLTRSDAQGASILLTSLLSIIFYARGAFPADCFQVVLDSQLRDPNVTHATLIRPGTPLSSVQGTREATLAEGGPFLYARKSGNPRMARFLDILDQIFVFLRHRRLGKIQFCLANTKTWDRESLLEFYSLKFSYTELGSVHIYLDWGGDSATSAPVHGKQSMRAFLRNRPPLMQPFYIHPFLYSIDGKSLNGNNGAGLGRGVKEAVAVLQNRTGTEVGRIDKFIYYSQAETAAEMAELQEAENRRKEDARKRKESVLEVVKSLSFRKTSVQQQAEDPRLKILEDQKSAGQPSQPSQSALLCSTPPEYEMPLWMKGEQKLDFLASPPSNSSPRGLLTTENPDNQSHNWLMANEEDLEDMPPTQPPGDPTGLDEQNFNIRRHEMASSLQPPSSYQSTITSSQAQR